MPNKAKKATEGQKLNAQEALEELFENYYSRRKEIYLMNFLRGIFFGFGSLVGGTIVVALLLWLLSSFEQVPLLDGVIRGIKEAFEK